MNRLLGWLRSTGAPKTAESSPSPSLPEFRPAECRSYAGFRDYSESQEAAWREQRTIEQGLIPHARSRLIDGFCHVCGQPRQFLVDFAYGYSIGGQIQPNWRERLVCDGCNLNNRVRACIHIFETVLGPSKTDRIYITEQTTPVYQYLAGRFPNIMGSEYISPDLAPGQQESSGLRHEDFTNLSFPDASLDFVLTFDVLEHIPDYPKALRESFRVLAPGGQLLLTAPFRSGWPSTLVRARKEDDGSITHIETPEYHGDPINPAGCLCFYHFGWDLLDTMRSEGFVDVRVLHYWSRQLGYLGPDQTAIVARKPS